MPKHYTPIDLGGVPSGTPVFSNVNATQVPGLNASSLRGNVPADFFNMSNVASGILIPVYGGLGFAANGVVAGNLIAGNGAGTFGLVGAPTLGQVLIGNPAASPGVSWSSLPMKGLLRGLTLSNNATDVDNDLDISPGCAWDNANDTLLVLASALTKRADAPWAVGSGNGGMDTGTKTASTWLHVWLIMRPDTGVVDALFSLSSTSPTMPANYTRKRRIGAVRVKTNAFIRVFQQRGDYFTWLPGESPDAVTTTLGTSDTNFATLVPTGFKVRAEFRCVATHATAGTMILIRDPDKLSSAPSTTAYPLTTMIVQVGSQYVTWEGSLYTNVSSEVTAVSSAANTTLRIEGIGYYDRRGQDDYS